MPALPVHCTGGPMPDIITHNPSLPLPLPLLSYENQLTTTIKVVLIEIKQVDTK